MSAKAIILTPPGGHAREGDKVKHDGKLLCLCITAGCLSAPLNGLSPSLTMVSKEYGYDSFQRDLYLGGYIALATMLGQMIGSAISGVLTDFYSRKRILITALLCGAAAMILFGLTHAYPVLLFLRVITGGCQGAIVPVLFSLLGDFYSVDERATYSAVVSSCLGGGMMLGQLFTGYMLSSLGWRLPFIIMGVNSFLAAIYLEVVLREPQKGAKEDALAQVLSQGISLPPLSFATFLESMSIPTVAIMLIQTVPNTVPWGVLSAHLHDFLATDEHLTMNEATSLIALFGAGAAFGGLLGGYVGGKLYNLSRGFLPLFMGITMAMSAILMKELMTMDLDAVGVSQMACPVLVLSGALAAINGANVRLIVLNLVTPQARGATVAVLNFVNNAGRGVGPSLIDIWMHSHTGGRKTAVSQFLNLWVVSGSMLCMAFFTIGGDEERMKQGLKKFAMSVTMPGTANATAVAVAVSAITSNNSNGHSSGSSSAGAVMPVGSGTGTMYGSAQSEKKLIKRSSFDTCAV